MKFLLIFLLCFSVYSSASGKKRVFYNLFTEEQIKKAQADVDEMHNCFKTSNTNDSIAKCALKYDYENRLNEKDWKVFFKERLVTFCKMIKKVDCSKEADLGYSKFFQYVYGAYKDQSSFSKLGALGPQKKNKKTYLCEYSRYFTGLGINPTLMFSI